MKKCIKCGEVQSDTQFLDLNTLICNDCQLENDRLISEIVSRVKYELLIDSQRLNAENKKKHELLISSKREKFFDAYNEYRLIRTKCYDDIELEIKESEKTKARERRDNLVETYIKQRLVASGFTPTQIAENPEFIELKRVIIKTKRFIKTKENEKH